MKRIKIVLSLFVSCIVFIGGTFVLGACTNNGSNTNSHEHDYKSEWTSDATTHWHDCKNEGCDEPNGDKAVHNDKSDDGKCDVCDYVTDSIKGSLLSFTAQNNDTYTVSNADKSISGEVVIPSTYKYSSVTSIGTHSLGFYAFENCKNLISIIVPNSVTSIDAASFTGCSNLESITLPFVGAKKDGTGYTHFGHIFSSYTANGYNASVPATLREVIITGGDNIDGEAFRYCSNITSIKLPDSLTMIHGSAFRDCTNLMDIVIPENVTEIGAFAFYNCKNLLSLKFAGTSAQWASISLGTNAIPDSASVICLGDNL